MCVWMYLWIKCASRWNRAHRATHTFLSKYRISITWINKPVCRVQYDAFFDKNRKKANTLREQLNSTYSANGRYCERICNAHFEAVQLNWFDKTISSFEFHNCPAKCCGIRFLSSEVLTSNQWTALNIETIVWASSRQTFKEEKQSKAANYQKLYRK